MHLNFNSLCLLRRHLTVFHRLEKKKGYLTKKKIIYVMVLQREYNFYIKNLNFHSMESYFWEKYAFVHGDQETKLRGSASTMKK